MKWLFNLFTKKRKMRRYVLNIRSDIPLEGLIELLQRHAPILSAREYAKLPVHLKALFVPAKGGK